MKFKTKPRTRLMNIRLTETLYSEYQLFCEEGSFSMSKRLRRLMQLDMQKWKKFKKEQILKEREEEERDKKREERLNGLE